MDAIITSWAIIFLGVWFGVYVNRENRKKKDSTSYLGYLASLIFICLGMLMLGGATYKRMCADKPQYDIVACNKVVSVEDDFVVVQLGDRLDTIPRTLRPITNWEPVNVDKSYRIFIDGNKYTFVDKNGQVTFERTLNPSTKWVSVK